MKVTVDNYIELSSRTNNPDYDKVRERIKENFYRDALGGALPPTIIGSAYLMDGIKKHTFYGKEFQPITVTAHKHTVLKGDLVKALSTEKMIDIYHGILGINSESGEFLEALVAHINGEELDEVNLVEEVGDVLWYCARILQAIGYTFEDAMDKNIRKLAKRFPDGFTELNAIHRDLDSERQELTN